LRNGESDLLCHTTSEKQKRFSRSIPLHVLGAFSFAAQFPCAMTVPLRTRRQAARNGCVFFVSSTARSR
jgi:hypothetical protein